MVIAGSFQRIHVTVRNLCALRCNRSRKAADRLEFRIFERASTTESLNNICGSAKLGSERGVNRNAIICGIRATYRGQSYLLGNRIK